MIIVDVFWRIIANVFFAHHALADLQRRVEFLEGQLEAMKSHVMRRNTKPSPVVRLC